jgi:hypothetical protein
MEQPGAAMARLERYQQQRSGRDHQCEVAERGLVAHDQIDDHQQHKAGREQHFGQ